MDRVQRSGLIALAVLLLTALGAHYVGSLPGSDATVPPRLAAQEPATLEGVKFLPPEQRQFFVGPADFVRPPVRNPMLGVQPRNIDASESVAADHRGGERGGGTQNASSGNSSGGTSKADPIASSDVGDVAAGGQAAALVPLDDDLPPRKPGRFIRVRENDNLTRIAKRELGDGNRWREIASLNGIPKPYHVRLGQRLQLPGDGVGGQASSASDHSGGDAVEAGGSVASSGAVDKPGSVYTVGKNETASHISLRFYGSPKHWKKILKYNGINDPKDLAAGQKIRIPPQVN